MNTKILLNERPHGEPKLGDFKTIKEDIIKPNDGEVLLKTIYMSLDPYMRGRMNDAKSYAKPVEIGEVMEAGALSQVIESKSKLFKPGDFVEGRTGWQDNPTVDEKKLRLIDPKMAPLSTSIGVLGMPGTTAYVGMHNFAKPQKGETLVVSAASGAVGATVGQIGKIYGCRVVGVAGTDDKCEFTKTELGFDDCVNYKDADFKEKLKSACPDGVDIYWENVGGITFDTVMPLLNDYARIPVCGLISLYNATSLKGGEKDRLPLLFRQILTKRMMIKGFIVFNHYDQREESIIALSKWIKEGKIKYKEDFVDGLENAPNAFIGLLNGKNFGKLVVKVNPDPTLQNIQN
jgi:NADPH-dependent curcumin reductase CurA